MTERPLLGVQLHSLVGLTEPKPVEEALRRVDELGVQITTCSLNWGDVEKDRGVWDWGRLDYWDAVKARAPRRIVPLFLLFPIHMNERGPMPADLREAPLGSDEMLDRWDAFVAEAAKRGAWDDDEAIVTVGNEVDWFIGAHPEQAEPAIAFLDAAAQAVTRHAPAARVVNTLQFGALSQPWGQDVVDALNAHTQLASFTWYDIDEHIHVPDPPTPLDTALSQMERAARGKPVLVQEFSMATGALNKGSEQLQAARVHEMFDALESRSRAQVEALVWLTIDDWPKAEMRQYVDAQFDEALAKSDVFFEFLTTLGIERAEGTRKPAYDAWVDRARSYRSSIAS